MNTLTTTKKTSLRNPDWETIISYTKVSKKPMGKTEHSEQPKTSPATNGRNMETVCAKLKNDLEWYCNLPEKNRSKTVLRNILDCSTPQELEGEIIEKWWLLS
ncbi:MAG: hypothetical protein ACXVC6_09935 [Bacteroidia bacterium]